MSFQSELTDKVKEYTEFQAKGFSIQIPYCLGAKNTPLLIRKKIWRWKSSHPKTKEQIQKYVSWNTGYAGNPGACSVDCSGLVYYVLNEATKGMVRSYFEKKLNLPALPYAYGINASNLTNPKLGTIIRKAKDVVPGCTIRFDPNGKHVLVVYSVTRTFQGTVKQIHYAHAATTAHEGIIQIADENQDLNNSKNRWIDELPEKYSDRGMRLRYQFTVLLNPVAIARQETM